MHPGWSFDGRELLFLSVRDGWTGAWAAPFPGGSGGRRILDHMTVRWSPVDRRVVYLHDRALSVAADDGRGNPMRLVPRIGFGRPHWTLDGEEVLFHGPADRPGLYIVRADGTGGERLLLDVKGRRGALGPYSTPTDGKYVYFTWNEDLGDLWVMNVNRE
jgi:Tol biopolymer transport system component